MSPEIRERARRRHLERNWRYFVVYPIAGVLGTIAFPFRHPCAALFVLRIRLHYRFGWRYPPVPM